MTKYDRLGRTEMLAQAARNRRGWEMADAEQQAQTGELNLSGWIDRRKIAVGPYADHIIKSVRAYEVEIERLRATLKGEET
jgi:hypothetical protein